MSSFLGPGEPFVVLFVTKSWLPISTTSSCVGPGEQFAVLFVTKSCQVAHLVPRTEAALWGGVPRSMSIVHAYNSAVLGVCRWPVYAQSHALQLSYGTLFKP